MSDANYWTGTLADASNAWGFVFDEGRQSLRLTAQVEDMKMRYSWTVRTGDIGTPVPLPASAWLLLSGMAGLGFIGRRRIAA